MYVLCSFILGSDTPLSFLFQTLPSSSFIEYIQYELELFLNTIKF